MTKDEETSLSFVSLSRQIEGAIEKGYSDMEIVEAVIKAMKPGMQLRSYLETVRDLTLPRLRQILMSHYKEKVGHNYIKNLPQSTKDKRRLQKRSY